MNSTIEIWRNRERLLAKAAAHNRASELASLKSQPIPTRRQAKAGRKIVRLYNKVVRQSQSMLNMQPDKWHRPVPLVIDERTKVLLAAHSRRREAGWIRG